MSTTFPFRDSLPRRNQDAFVSYKSTRPITHHGVGICTVVFVPTLYVGHIYTEASRE